MQEPQPVERFATDEDELPVALFEDRPVKDRLLVLEGEEKADQSTEGGEVEGARRGVLEPVEDVAWKCNRAGLGVLETPRECRDPELLVGGCDLLLRLALLVLAREQALVPRRLAGELLEAPFFLRVERLDAGIAVSALALDEAEQLRAFGLRESLRLERLALQFGEHEGVAE